MSVGFAIFLKVGHLQNPHLTQQLDIRTVELKGEQEIEMFQTYMIWGRWTLPVRSDNDGFAIMHFHIFQKEGNVPHPTVWKRKKQADVVFSPLLEYAQDSHPQCGECPSRIQVHRLWTSDNQCRPASGEAETKKLLSSLPTDLPSATSETQLCSLPKPEIELY